MEKLQAFGLISKINGYKKQLTVNKMNTLKLVGVTSLKGSYTLFNITLQRIWVFHYVCVWN